MYTSELAHAATGAVKEMSRVYRRSAEYNLRGLRNSIELLRSASDSEEFEEEKQNVLHYKYSLLRDIAEVRNLAKQAKCSHVRGRWSSRCKCCKLQIKEEWIPNAHK